GLLRSAEFRGGLGAGFSVRGGPRPRPRGRVLLAGRTERGRRVRLPRGGGFSAAGVGATAGTAGKTRAGATGAAAATRPGRGAAGDQGLCGPADRSSLPTGARVVSGPWGGAGAAADRLGAVVLPRGAAGPGHGAGPWRGTLTPGREGPGPGSAAARSLCPGG